MLQRHHQIGGHDEGKTHLKNGYIILINIFKRPPMPLRERTGIFQPFSALSGLHEAILAEQQCHSEQQRHSDKVKSQKGNLK